MGKPRTNVPNAVTATATTAMMMSSDRMLNRTSVASRGIGGSLVSCGNAM